jgi:putative ABC transport system permease protein
VIKGFRYALNKFWSETLSGDLLILSLSIVLAVTSISSVSFLGDRLQTSMKLQASSILGADLVLRSASAIDPNYLELGVDNNLNTAETITFLSMVITDDDNLLTSIKTTSESYPLKGELIIADFDGSLIQNSGSPPSGSVWIEPKIAETLSINNFSEISIGNKTFKVGGIIKDFPDRNSSFVGFYPIAIVNINDVSEMGVIQTGSRVIYRNMFSGSKRNLDNFVNDIGEIPADIRLQQADDVGDELGEALKESATFFNLASLFTVIISVISAMMAVRRYATRNLLHASLMKVFGASKLFILGHQIMQLLLIIFFATIFGLLCGFALQSLIISALQGILTNELPAPSFKPVILGFITSIFVVLATASPYLKILSQTEPIRILRNDFSINISNNLIIYIVALVSMFIFLGILFQDIKLLLYILLVLIFVTAALYAIGKTLIYLLSSIKFSSGAGWKIGLKNIVTRGNESILQIIIFGLSLLFLIVLAETRTDLIDSWSETLEDDTPNYFLFNIQEYDLVNVTSYLSETANFSPSYTPLIRGRLLSAKRSGSDEFSSENLMDREANLTWQESLPKSNKISKGEWWNEDSEEAEVSIDAEVAESMNLEIGDELLFSAGGSKFSATVTSFREIEWESFSPNFFFILSPSAGQKLPNSYITSIKISEQSDIMNLFTQRFPTITAVDLAAVIQQIRNTVSSASLAVQYIFLLTLIAGILALVASVFSNRDQRTKETAIMHAIGANRSIIFQSAAAEFFILGILSGFTAIIFAIILSSIIFSQFLNLQYYPNLLILGLSFTIGVIFIFISGVLSIRKTIYTSPVITLRDS